MEMSTRWAVNGFLSWMKCWNFTVKGSHRLCPENILLCDDHKELCSWLCICVIELQKVDCNSYTPRSIANFVAGLQQYISQQKNLFLFIVYHSFVISFIIMISLDFVLFIFALIVPNLYLTL